VIKFLVQARYTADGTKGLLKEGAIARRKAVEELMTSVGGKVEEFYFTFGVDDAILIVDLPNEETALAIAATVRASGMIQSTMTRLIPVAELERALEQHVKFRAPGSS
jgi:uncharacterized protein with GYD domain